MTASYANLLAVLNEQLTAMDDLIELGLVETSAFQVDDVAQIAFIVEQQRDTVRKMQVLEMRKADILNSIGTGLSTDKPDENNQNELRLEAENIASCLFEQARRLKEINETNRLLAQMSLSYSRMMQKALGLTGSNYNEKGAMATLPGYWGRLDASA